MPVSEHQKLPVKDKKSEQRKERFSEVSEGFWDQDFIVSPKWDDIFKALSTMSDSWLVHNK